MPLPGSVVDTDDVIQTATDNQGGTGSRALSKSSNVSQSMGGQMRASSFGSTLTPTSPGKSASSRIASKGSNYSHSGSRMGSKGSVGSGRDSVGSGRGSVGSGRGSVGGVGVAGVAERRGMRNSASMPALSPHRQRDSSKEVRAWSSEGQDGPPTPAARQPNSVLFRVSARSVAALQVLQGNPPLNEPPPRAEQSMGWFSRRFAQASAKRLVKAHRKREPVVHDVGELPWSLKRQTWTKATAAFRREASTSLDWSNN